MEDNQNIDSGFEEFAAAFEDADDYQTDSAEETEQTETVEDDAGNAEETSEEEENTEADADSEGEEKPEEKEQKPEPEQKFAIKVNKETREVGIAEMTELAQKGADYDRVKDQLTESRQTIQEMQGKMGQYQSAFDVLDAISKQSGKTFEETLKQIQLNFKMQGGKTEAEAEAELRAEAAEKELNAVKAKQTQQPDPTKESQARAEKEVADFYKRFPKVELTKELLGELMPEVHKGKSLAEAYQTRENAKQAERIEELERQLAAEKQNNKNRAKSPGSQKDSGGRRVKTDFDDFMSAFN